MYKNISLYREYIGCTIGELAKEVQRIVNTVVQNPVVTFRIKDPRTLQKKMRLKGARNIFVIDDVYGIRIIVASVGDVYAVLEKIKEVFPGYLDHDYFREPKTSPSVNGNVLRFLQFVAYRNNVPFEIQITTIACNAVNELLHDGYHRRKYHF